MQFGKRVHADFRAVGQLHVDMLAAGTVIVLPVNRNLSYIRET